MINKINLPASASSILGGPKNNFNNFIALAKVKSNPLILEFIRESESALKALSYTEHGLRHATLVSDRGRNIAYEIGLDEKEAELAAIAGFCHDMGNFVGRTEHHYWGAMLFSQIFHSDFSPKNLTKIMEAISNHDKEGTMRFTNVISAIVVLADKSDVDRKRVIAKDISEIKKDIHDRVNYATRDAHLKVNKKLKKIILTLKIDTRFVEIIEYFEIFTKRMTYCRTAAQYLGYDFDLIINNVALL
ncbi:HD domain-containing protein [Patescibacteria group bacterium]|nr:HD domain-containing protein [Patescibacteria group bacterium]